MRAGPAGTPGVRASVGRRAGALGWVVVGRDAGVVGASGIREGHGERRLVRVSQHSI